MPIQLTFAATKYRSVWKQNIDQYTDVLITLYIFPSFQIYGCWVILS